MENRLHYFFSVRCCSLFLLFLALSSKADEVEDESLDLYSPIYFGDSSVNVGEPFKINCRISISSPTEWLKDGESIRTHNLRHGRDDHSYVVTENEIEAAQVVGHYDNTEHKLRSYAINFPLTLSCNVTAPKFPELKWRKNGTDVEDVSSLKGRYKILEEERKFIIEKTVQGDAGLYECWVDSLKQGAIFNVYANIAVRVPSNTGVVEGEKLTISCTVAGTEPNLSWQIGNKTINETTGRYILKDDNGIKNAIFSITNISMEDRGEYKCIGTSPATEYGNADVASDTSMVRIKGKLAALWPFIGICVEVVVLCAIILIYEKRRNKTELEESDTDPNTDQEKLKPPTN